MEYYLSKNNYSISDIPTVVTYDQLVEWGFTNPLKRYGYSPYNLINALYPGKFDQYDFRKVPQGSTNDQSMVIKQFFKILEKENIKFNDVPKKVTQEMLNRHRLNCALKHINNSPSELIKSLFPEQFNNNDFIKTNRYWQDVRNVKKTIFDIITKYNIPHEKVPQTITKKLLADNGLSGLRHQYNGSPFEIINVCFPNEFLITEFTRVPNRYWYNKENRINALRTYCRKINIKREQIPNLTRAYFKKHFSKFISVVDRHYESKFYLWINEAFPEHHFRPNDFKLHIGDDGQLCDSKEELMIHNFLISNLKNAKLKRENIRFLNNETNLL